MKVLLINCVYKVGSTGKIVLIPSNTLKQMVMKFMWHLATRVKANFLMLIVSVH